MLVANIKIWKSHLNIREGSDYSSPRSTRLVNPIAWKTLDLHVDRLLGIQIVHC